MLSNIKNHKLVALVAIAATAGVLVLGIYGFQKSALPTITSIKSTTGLPEPINGNLATGGVSTPTGLGKDLRHELADRSLSLTDRNAVANMLREARDPNMVADLTTMLWDSSEPAQWRNYCVQHLCQCYQSKPDPVVLDTIFKAAHNNETLIRICAVWSLAIIATPKDPSKMPEQVTVEKIRAIALQTLREKDAHFLITEAGVQSCARLGLTEALPEIRALAASNETKPEHLRIVSVAALGDLKDTVSIPLLEKLSKEATGQLQSAARLALTRLSQPIPSNSTP